MVKETVLLAVVPRLTLPKFTDVGVAEMVGSVGVKMTVMVQASLLPLRAIRKW